MELDRVSFAYDKESGGLLKDLSLHIAPGEKIALVGYNGAGKRRLSSCL